MQTSSSRSCNATRVVCALLALCLVAWSGQTGPGQAVAQDATPDSQEQVVEAPPPTPTPTPTPLPPPPTLAPPTPTPTPAPPTPTPIPPEPTAIPDETVSQDVQVQEVEQPAVEPVNDATPGVSEPTPTPTPVQVAPTAVDIQLACAPDTISAVVDGEPIAVTCTFRGGDTLAEREVTLTEVTIAAPDGWMVAGADGVATSALVVPAGAVIGFGDTFAASFRVSIAGCDATASTVSVQSTLTYEASGAIAGPSTTIAVAVDLPPAAAPEVATGSLAFGTSDATGSGYPTLTASVPVRISVPESSRCAEGDGGWALQVRSDGLYQVETGEHIPAGAMVYLGTSSSGAPDGVTPVAADVPLGAEPVTIAHLGDVSGDGGAWMAVFTLAPPPGVSPGTYGGSITFTVIRAP